MSSGWLTNVANLLVFFRCTTIWLNIVMLALSLFPYNILAAIVFSVTGVAAIYNITVVIVQHKEKKRTTSGNFPVPSLAVIIIDYIFGLVYIAAWIVTTFFVLSGYHYSYGPVIFKSFTQIGCLVAWHYHLFYAAVATHIRRKQGQGIVIPLTRGEAVAAATAKSAAFEQDI